MKIVEVLLMSVLLCGWANAQEEDAEQSPIETNAEYLAAIEPVIEDFYGTVAYLGNDSIWEATRVKAERILAIDERITGERVSEEIRNTVFMARTLDLIALAVADSRTRPFTNTKLHRLRNYPGS